MGYGDLFSVLSPDAVWKSVKSSASRFSGYNDNSSYHKVKTSEHIPSGRNVENFLNMAQLARNVFVRVAGLSGAVAVAMGAYGTHGFFPRKDVPDELKEVYKTANYYHFLHTMALLGVPLTRRPLLVGSVISAGMSIFCGTCYYYALTGDASVCRFTPYGGFLLILGWLTMLL